MKLLPLLGSLVVGLAVPGLVSASGAHARTAEPTTARPSELQPYLQCVPFAREISGIQIYGDAYTWWDQAEGRYRRGREPEVGSVMAFMPTERMQLGHVATVTKIVDRRTVLLDHANWSPIEGRRGQIERGVAAVDVSPGNDWSEVRVWYAPLQDLGTTRWPVAGFIYADSAPIKGGAETRLAAGPARELRAAPALPVGSRPSRDFTKAFAALSEGVPAPMARPPKSQSGPAKAAPETIERKAAVPKPAPQADPFAGVLARYD